MEGQHHPIAEEFQGYKDEIHSLKMNNAHFAKLFQAYEEIDKKIARSESRIEILSETEEGELRKRRLNIKDELFVMLNQAKTEG